MQVSVTKEFETLFENSIARACSIAPNRVLVLRSCQDTGEVDFTIEPDEHGLAHAVVQKLRDQLANSASPLWEGTLSKFASHIVRFSAILPSPHCLWTPDEGVLKEPTLSLDLQDLQAELEERPDTKDAESSDDEVDVRKRPEFWGVRVRELSQFQRSIHADLNSYCTDHKMCFGSSGCIHLCKKGSACQWGDHCGIQHQKLEDKAQANPLLPNMHAVPT